MRFQKGKAKILSGVLFSSTLFLFNQAEVLALAPTNASPSPSTSVPVTSISTPVASSTTTNFIPTSSTAPSTNIVTPAPTVPNQTYTGDKPLDSAITDATSQGISVVEAPESSVPTTTAQKTDYNNQTTIITDVTKQYVADKAVYASQDKAYQDYLAKQGQCQKDMASYQAYLKAKAVYDQQMKVYNTAKANYDMAYNQALANTNKTGYLPEVLAQNLIFRLEPNATQTITGKLLSDADLAKATKNSVGWIDPGTVIGNPKLATITTKNKWNSALVSVGESVVVDYTGLENSSFSGHALTHVRYTYKLISTTHYSGKVVFQAIADPTETSYTHIYNKDGKTRSSFEFQLTVQLFDAQGNEMIPTAANYALTSFASLNSRNGNGEYVSNYNGRFIPINGSTISVENSKAANFSSTDQATTIAGWDDKNSPDAYIGAIVGQSTDRISFNFGNTHGFADWFAFNSDVKTSGGIVTPPILPTAPKAVAKPIKPTAVSQPSAIPTPIIFYHKVRVVAPLAITSKPLKVIPTYITSPTTYHYSPVLYYFAPPVKNYGTIYKAPVVVNNGKQITVPSFDWKKAVKQVVQATTKATLGVVGTKENKVKKKVPKLSNPIDWFNYNTGVNDYKSGNTDVIEFIKSLGKKANSKYKGNKSVKDREIAQAIADLSYHYDPLQTKFNYFGKPLKGVNNEVARTKIDKAHASNLGNIDLAHLATTLASLENQGKNGKKQEYIKLFATLRGFVKLENLFVPIFASDKKTTIRQQNSFIGDIFTDMPQSDVYTDMDIMILSKHPKYKDMPMDQRIIAYYSQDLSKERGKLFKEVYGKNKNESENNFLKELVGSTAVLSIAGLIGYSAVKGKTKNIPKNIHLLDTMLLNRKIDKFKKHPIKTTAKIITKAVNKHIVKPVKKYIIKPIASAYKKAVKQVQKVKSNIYKQFNKHIVKPIVSIYKKTVKQVRKLRSNIGKISYRVNRKVVSVLKYVARGMAYPNFIRPVRRNSVRTRRHKGRKR